MTPGPRVFVCGGRTYGEADATTPMHLRGQERVRLWRQISALNETLDRLHADRGIACVIQGGAKGADRHAKQWAASRRVEVAEFPADWNGQGKAAGPNRNARMLAEGHPDIVVTCPGGRGIADMVRRAKAAGIPIIRIQPQGDANAHPRDRRSASSPRTPAPFA